MTKQNVKVEVTTIAGFNVTADDAVLAGQGTAAYGAIDNHRDVKVSDGGKITFVPYAAIDHAIVTFDRKDVEDPEDPTCVEP